MLNGMHARGAQHIEEIKSIRNAPRHNHVDVPTQEIIRMRVIGGEHHQLRILADDWPQRIEVARRTSLAHQDVHPPLRFLARFV